jgi:hypothetical protein
MMQYATKETWGKATLVQNKFHKSRVSTPSSQINVIPAKAGIHFEMTIISSFHQTE